MTLDALDPGEDYSFPNVPRTPDGLYLDTERMPIGLRQQTGRDGRTRLIDVTPTVRLIDGRLVPVTDVVPPPPPAA